MKGIHHVKDVIRNKSRRKKRKIEYRILAVVCIFCIMICTPITVQAQKSDYDTVLDKLKQLENYASEYHAENQQDTTSKKTLVVSYLISDRYQGGLWDKLALYENPQFEAYVIRRDTEISCLKYLETVRVPGDYEVDFLHLIAVLYVADDAGGWVGDLTQFTAELKEKNIKDPKQAMEQMNLENSSFSKADFCADIDGANMTKIYHDKDLTETLQEYYNAAPNAFESNTAKFAKDRFANSNEKENLEKSVLYTYRSYWIIQQLYDEFGIDAKMDQQYITAATTAFADKLYQEQKSDKTSIKSDCIKEDLQDVNGNKDKTFLYDVLKDERNAQEDSTEMTVNSKYKEKFHAVKIRMVIGGYVLLTISVFLYRKNQK